MRVVWQKDEEAERFCCLGSNSRKLLQGWFESVAVRCKLYEVLVASQESPRSSFRSLCSDYFVITTPRIANRHHGQLFYPYKISRGCSARTRRYRSARRSFTSRTRLAAAITSVAPTAVHIVRYSCK